MKIIDCFIFYNEIDILNYRINTYSDLVDYFIIVESKYTFSGNEKELYFENNKDLFSQYKDKIIHIVLDTLPYIYPNIDYDKKEQWINEKYQRNSIVKGINEIKDKLCNDDIIIISDVDEIPDYFFLQELKRENILIDINTPHILKQYMYYYNLNTYTGEWYHSKLLSYQLLIKLNVKNVTIDNIRMNFSYPIIDKCGWHLSYFGNIDFIRNKLLNFSHQEFNKEKFTDIKNIREKLNNQVNLFDKTKLKNIPINENTYLPYKYEKYLSKYVIN